MKRRDLCFLLAAGLGRPGVLLAQAPKRVYRVALLDDAVESARAPLWKVFRDRLRELLLAQGRDVAYEVRFARGDPEALLALAKELVALNPDLIVGGNTSASAAARKATASIPIVMASSGDPVGTGLVASLARPGGNVTGISILAPELAAKQFELMRDLAPAARRLAHITDFANPATKRVVPQFEERARQFNVSLQVFDGHQKDSLEQAFAAIKRERLQGLLVGASGVLLEHRAQIVQFAAANKLPAVYARREYVDAGGLIAFSTDQSLGYRRAAEIAHRILNGAKPAEVPVEQMSTTRTVVNRKTARALGIKIPEHIRARVDEVIE